MTEAGAAWMVEYWERYPFDEYVSPPEEWVIRASKGAVRQIRTLPAYKRTWGTFDEGPTRDAFIQGARAMGKLLGAPL